MTHRFRIAIVGYGIGGVAAAILLRRLGHDVEHFERGTRRAEIGAGLLLHPSAFDSLTALGLSDAVFAIALPVHRLVARTRSGREIMSISYSEIEPEARGLGIMRSALAELLRRADPGRDRVRHGLAVMSATPTDGRLRLSDGTECGPYDLVVAADGVNSAIRRGLPRIVAHDRPYDSAAVVIAVNDPCNLSNDQLSQHFDGTRHVSFWPVGSLDPDTTRKASVAVNVPHVRARASISSGEWRRLATRICPSLSLLLESREETTRPIVYTYRDVTLNAHVHGRIAFIGDAAHSMSPQLGRGAGLALHDACLLARKLDEGDSLTTALQRFDAAQKARLPPLQRASRWLTPMFQSKNRPLAALRDVLGGPLSRQRALRSRIKRLLVVA